MCYRAQTTYRKEKGKEIYSSAIASGTLSCFFLRFCSKRPSVRSSKPSSENKCFTAFGTRGQTNIRNPMPTVRAAADLVYFEALGLVCCGNRKN